MSEIIYNPEIDSLSSNIDLYKRPRRHYGIVYHWWNVFDQKKLGGYVGMTLAVIPTDILSSPRLKQFENFNRPYAGKKINIARAELPIYGWRLEILCIVISESHSDTLKITLEQERENILALDSVENGYNTTYGGEHGYIDINKYILTGPLSLKLPKSVQNPEDNIDIFKLNLKQAKQFFGSSYGVFVIEEIFSKDNISNGGFDEEKMIKNYNWEKPDSLEDFGITVSNFSDLNDVEKTKIKTSIDTIARIDDTYYISKKLIKIITTLLEFRQKSFRSVRISTKIDELGLELGMGENYPYPYPNSKPCYEIRLIRDKETNRYVRKVTFFGSRIHAYYKSPSSGSYQRVLYCSNNNTGGFMDGDVGDFVRRYIEELFGL